MNIVDVDHLYWAQPSKDVLESLDVNPKIGLSTMDANKRQLLSGRNQLQAARPRSVTSILIDQFRSIVVVLLVSAAALAFLFSSFVEGLAIVAVIAINSVIGFVTEWRAARSMESLKRLGQVITTVVRDSSVTQIAAVDLVPGDIVLIDAGDTINADIRLFEAAQLQLDESMLTGESLPVLKQASALAPQTMTLERHNMLFKGTGVTRGTGKGVVTDIGMNTELGRISSLAAGAESQLTPLEERLNTLGERLAIAVLILAVLIAIAGILSGRGTFLSIEVAVALAVAAIPEGLPIVATIALARGMWRMARRNALISKLSAVETLGATSLIITDKTGTLTENHMTATAFRVAGVDGIIRGNAVRDHNHPAAEQVVELLTIAALCNNAFLQDPADPNSQTVGDPTEIALLDAALWHNIRKDKLLKRLPRASEVPFDPDTRVMATIHTSESGTFAAAKGAPEALLPLCSKIQTSRAETQLTSEEVNEWLSSANDMGKLGLRTLAIATKKMADPGEDPLQELVLLGIVGLEDPPRPSVKTAIEQCHNSGIAVVMVTGDHHATAQKIASDVGIVSQSATSSSSISGADLVKLLEAKRVEEIDLVSVVSRAMPEHKLALIRHFQDQDHIVAMTGDGVNDAPALKKADIGIAMGLRGTAVAKEAAHMVLQDDEFGTIVEAVRQGRAIYENIRKFVIYLLSCNISEIGIIGIATLAGAPLPLLPLQILFLNLVTDIFPALALGIGEGSPSLMDVGPRPANEPLLTRNHWARIAVFGMTICASVLGAMAVAILVLNYAVERAVTISFCTLACAQLVHVFNMRDEPLQIFRNEITRNVWIWSALLLCVILILLVIYVPFLSQVFALTDPGIEGWLIIVPMSLMPFAISPFLLRILPRQPGPRAQDSVAGAA